MPYVPTGKPNGRPPQPLSDRVQKAVEVEAERALTDQPPMTLQQLADESGMTRAACAKWRRNPRYQAALSERFGELAVERLLEKAAERDYRETRKRDRASWWLGESRNHWRTMSEDKKNEYRRDWLLRWATENWTGPARSPVDGRIYETPEAYAEHLFAADMIPAEGWAFPVST